jgi:hypothetical protein
MTMESKELISDQSRADILNYTLLNIQTGSQQLQGLREFDVMLEEIKSQREKANLLESEAIAELRQVAGYSILIGLISNDLAVSYRIYLRAEDNYEVQFAAKQIVVIITEGFKKIYNYIGNKQGVTLTSNRNNSLWKKSVGGIVLNTLRELVEDYAAITADLDKFDDLTLNAMKAPRDFFVHYDTDPRKAFDALQDVHIQEVTDKAIPFMQILRRMMAFNNLMLSKYMQVIIKSTEDEFLNHRNILENLRGENIESQVAVSIIDEGLQNLERIKQEYDRRQHPEL